MYSFYVPSLSSERAQPVLDSAGFSNADSLLGNSICNSFYRTAQETKIMIPHARSKYQHYYCRLAFFDPQYHVPVGEAFPCKFSPFLSLPRNYHEFDAKSARLSRYDCRSMVGTYESSLVAPSPMVSMSFCTLFLLPLVIGGQLINHTIDDTLGDELTGHQAHGLEPTYYPSLGNLTAQMPFHGSAIYVYMILSNSPKSTGFVSDVVCDFRIDGEVVGSYNHDTDGTYEFEYNVLAYRNVSLSDEEHTLVIESTGTKPSYLIFDYAIYTNSQSPILLSSPTTSPLFAVSSNPVSPSSGAPSSISSAASPSSSSLAKTFGGAIAVGVLALVILPASMIFYIRRFRRRSSTPETPEAVTHPHSLFQPFSQTPRQPTAVGLYDAESSNETLTAQMPAPTTWRQRREIYEL
ncbi:hypothetical protein IW261DRAFT_1425486 [Armillaria novae-zelandiae]|uniref:Mid2 domain-containing protein n=1 Tax=Armillaria novae-zelandiae TaxID=153914 RepID=A0AA39NSE0_9AGAR|nr:hypothetical protein IW261DRAFT_1425486 [Armillaria novae-zelandiae]